METALQELKNAREKLLKDFSAGKVTDTFQNDYTEEVDQYLRKRVQESRICHELFHRKIPFAFVAVGGYGRKDLCVNSDIDVILLFGRSIPPQAGLLMREILWPLWDTGLEVGYGTRTIKNCVGLSKQDFKVLTSMLEARLICGDSPLYLELLEQLRTKVLSKKKKASFWRWLKEMAELRMKLYGDASYLLEPNLKEGIGGLRDYHCMLWASRVYLDLIQPRDLEYQGVLSHQEFGELQKHLSLIWRVRNQLHLVSGRKNDRLALEYQEIIAKGLGYEQKDSLEEVEAFLGDVHAAMASIKSVCSSFMKTDLGKPRTENKRQVVQTDIELVNGELCFSSPERVLSKPGLMFDIFVVSATRGIRISTEAKRLIREFLFLVNDKFRASKEASGAFLAILNGPYAFEALEGMLEAGLLGAYIPEFQIVRDRVQFDTYHIYPVGRHLLETFRRIKEIHKEGEVILTTILSEVRHPQRLLLAALLHDIGKTGRNHSIRGASIAGRILERMGWDDDSVEDVAFLIRHHLLLVETATRRDLEDEKVVVQLARTVGNDERLRMLYLLAWADGVATGPRAWNEWIANLVQELFFKALHILAQKQLATDDADTRFRKTRAALSKLLTPALSREEIHHYIDVMSPRYLLSMPPAKVSKHIWLAKDLSKKVKDKGSASFILEPVYLEAEKCWELTFLGKDRPGLFSDIAGVLALNNVNILSARINTWSDGTVVDIFQVTPPLDPIEPHRTWKKIARELEEVLSGKSILSHRLAQRTRPSIIKKAPKSSKEPEVLIDNEASDFFTVVEIFANDRLGILFTITKLLFELDLDIRVAKISATSWGSQIGSFEGATLRSIRAL